MSDKIKYEELLARLSEPKSGLIDRYWDDYVKHKDLSFVVKPSIPIIWFGDLEAYSLSALKVVTIAHNPSWHEFCEKEGGKYSTLLRFPDATSTDQKALIRSYNNYFETNSYNSWFMCFDNIFKLFPRSYQPVSYYKSENEKQNTAIHIDYFTALATKPAWTKLDSFDQDKIQRTDLFKELLEQLNPDVILFTSNKENLNSFLQSVAPKEVKRIPLDYRYIKGFTFPGKLLIYGSFSHGKPFGFRKPKEEICKIFEYYQP